MSKKYVGKMKSFKELMDLAEDVDKKGTLWFKGRFQQQAIGFGQELKCLCGKTIEFINYNENGYDYKDETPIYFLKEWFSEIKEVENNEVWKPKEGENYICLHPNGNNVCIENFSSNYLYKKETIQSYNYWKTKEEAKIVERSMKLYRAMKRWSFCNDNGYEFIHSKRNTLIYYDTYEKKYSTQAFGNTKLNTEVYFSTEEKAKQCLEWLKKEGLL